MKFHYISFDLEKTSLTKRTSSSVDLRDEDDDDDDEAAILQQQVTMLRKYSVEIWEDSF